MWPYAASARTLGRDWLRFIFTAVKNTKRTHDKNSKRCKGLRRPMVIYGWALCHDCARILIRCHQIKGHNAS